MKKIISTITALALVLLPNVNFGQAPTLGSAADFVLFSSVGAVTNSGTTFLTRLTGHVGANSGAISGFGNVDGNMYAGGPQSALCAIDVLSAYNQLNSTVATLFPGPALGSGQILTPGVHLISGPATLNLNLILDGLGNPSAVFIIKIQGSFSAAANSKVKLINGTKACNVFWKVEGLVSLATGINMKGTIIANNAAISMSVGDTLEGRALTTNGAITVSQILGYTPLGCGVPILNGPISPTLASAACYGIFSANGAVTNVGITYVTGDIGSNLGSALGYNPLFVTGTIHPIPDGSTGACATDLLNAYSYLNALPYDILLLYPAQFGNNLVLTPHTYLLNGAVTLTDSLYLNAEGNSNAVFIIQINGALSTTANSKINLINGAQSKNVYWKVDGAVTLNANSIFRGTIVCNNGAMNLNTGVFLDGRALTTNGALSTSAVTVTIPSSISVFSAPASQTVCAGSLASFSVSASGSGLNYQWMNGTTPLVNSGNISGATSATLVFNPVNITNASSNYNVVITGGCGANYTSTNVSLVISASASITSQPSNQVACAGNSVSFSSAASGSGLSYQWKIGTVNLVNGGNISGATTATLVINPAGISDVSTNYNVVVTGACAPSSTSTNVSLTINTTTITSQPSNQVACPGNSVSFSAIASGPGLTYQWRKGTTNLINGGNIFGATTATLILNPANVPDVAANYNVVVIGTCAPSNTSINVSLSIGGANIVSQPSNQTACPGDLVSFTTNATGSGLTYQWRIGTTNLNNVGNVSGATTATLTLNPVTVSDIASNYNVVVTGACAPNITSNMVSLSISAPVAVASINSTVCPGGSINLQAQTITGGTYKWNGPNSYSSTIQNPVISPAAVTDAGTYTLTVSSNGCTSAPSTIIVDVIKCFDFFIPEGFSPNGDGINDVFFIRGIDSYPNNTFMIFNRWGDKLFEASPYKNTWDGKATQGLRFGGDELPVGTYFYLLDLKNETPVYKGTIYLNR